MKKTFIAIKYVILTTLVPVLEANAGNQAFPAVQVCYAHADMTVGSAGRLINTASSSYPFVFCGIGQDKAKDTNDDVLVFYSDKSNTADADVSLNSVFCYAQEVADDYSVVVDGEYGWGCSDVGGCSNSTDPRWTGSGYIRLEDVTHGGRYFTVIGCSIPVKRSELRSLSIIAQ